MSYPFWPHGLQHARLSCTSLSPGVCSNSCSLCQWCHPTISSSVGSFSFPEPFTASGLLMLFASGGQSIGASASASVLPINSQGWFPSGLVWSPCCPRYFSSSTIQKYQFFSTPPSLWSNSHICSWLLEKSYLWLYRILSAKWCVCFLTCCLGLS